MTLSADALWILVCTSLVVLTPVGFLCLDAGATKRKNSVNVVLKNLANFSLSVLAFWWVGYGVMYGTSFHGWIGGSLFAPDLGQSSAWSTLSFLWAAMVCSLSASIASRAGAGRLSVRGSLFLSILMAGCVYPFFGHWAWHGLHDSSPTGWLGAKGFVDGAGATVIHSVGGWAALATVVVMGPRLGRFSRKRSRSRSPQTPMALALFGTVLLWFGWFGLTAGGYGAFDHHVPGLLANTLLAGVAGVLASLLWMVFSQQAISVYLVINGALAGLVSITASGHAVSSLSAVLIGSVGGLVMMAMTAGLQRWNIDDAVGAIPVHLGGGLWGTVAVALFGNLERLGTGLTRGEQLRVQGIGVVACGLWVFPVVLVLALLLNHWQSLRISRKQEYRRLQRVAPGVGRARLYSATMAQGTDPVRRHVAGTANSGLLPGILPDSEGSNSMIQTLGQVIARLDGIVTTAVDGIMTVDPETLTIQSANPAVEDLFGHSWLRLVGQPLTEVMGTDLNALGQADADALACLLYKGCRMGEPLEAVGFHNRVRPFPIEFTVSQSRVETERFWTLVVRDISDRKAAEIKLQRSELQARQTAERLQTALLQLQQTQAQLIQTEKMAGLGQLVAGLAHEINNPVSFIHGNLSHANIYVQELLQVLHYYQIHCPPLPAEAQQKVDDIDLDFLRADFPKLLSSMQTGTTRIRDIVRSLKTFSRKDEAAFKATNVLDGMDSTLLILASRLKATPQRSSIEVYKDYCNLPPLKCYGSAINQVFFHLLNNAIDTLNQCPRWHQGRITISTKATSQHVVIHIADNGQGIPTAIQPRIFEPFFTTKDVGQGPGMGLAISHQIIVEQHGGQLTCQSQVGQGTEFTITLPRKPKPPASANRAARDSAGPTVTFPPSASPSSIPSSMGHGPTDASDPFSNAFSGLPISELSMVHTPSG